MAEKKTTAKTAKVKNVAKATTKKAEMQKTKKTSGARVIKSEPAVSSKVSANSKCTATIAKTSTKQCTTKKLKSFYQSYYKVMLYAIIALVGAVLAAFIAYKLLPRDKELQTGKLYDFSNEQQLVMGGLLGSVYRQLYGYNDVCKDFGYEIHTYTKQFRKVMSVDLQRFDKIWRSVGLSTEKAFELFITEDVHQQINAELVEEMTQIASKDNATIKDVCIFLETNAVAHWQQLEPQYKEFYGKALEFLEHQPQTVSK